MTLPKGYFNLPFDLPEDYYPPLPYPRPGDPPPPENSRVYTEPYEYLPARAAIGIKIKSHSKIAEEEDLYEIVDGIYGYFQALVNGKSLSIKGIDLVAYGFQVFSITKKEILIQFYAEYDPKNRGFLYSSNFGAMHQLMNYSLSEHLEDLLNKDGEFKFRDLLKSLPVKYNEFQTRVETEWDEAGRVLPYSMQSDQSSLFNFEINSLFIRWNEMREVSGDNFPLEIPELRGNVPNIPAPILEPELEEEEFEPEIEEGTEEVEIQLPFDNNPGSIDAYLSPLPKKEINEIARMIGMERIDGNKFNLIDDIIDHLMD
jgi:hypothetical protein